MSKWNRSIGSNTYDGVTPLVNMTGKAYRPSLQKWSVSYAEWKDEAACNGLPTQLFELNDEIDADEQHELIAQGLRICVGCPVRAACKSNSNEEDRHWTIRGGQPPEGLFEDAKVPKIKLYFMPRGHKPGEGPERKLKEKCKYGHIDWVVDNGGKRRCATCRKTSANAARKNRSGGKVED